MGDSQSNAATVLPTARRGIVRAPDPAFAPKVLALVAISAGMVRAYPMGVRPWVSTHMGDAEVRYVTADRYLGVHLPGEPLTTVWEIAADRCRVILRSEQLAALHAFLASNPEVQVDLDADDLADDTEAA